MNRNEIVEKYSFNLSEHLYLLQKDEQHHLIIHVYKGKEDILDNLWEVNLDKARAIFSIYINELKTKNEESKSNKFLLLSGEGLGDGIPRASLTLLTQCQDCDGLGLEWNFDNVKELTKKCVKCNGKGMLEFKRKAKRKAA